MIKHNQDGAINGLAFSLVTATILLVAVIIFGAWAFTGRQDYKNNADIKIADATKLAKEQESVAKDKEFAEANKNPLKSYTSPEAFGSLVVNYPKSWSGYVDDTGQGDSSVSGYFAPGVVPSATDQNSVFALRIKLVTQTYAQTLQNLSDQQSNGELSIKAYALPKMPSIVGVEVVGKVPDVSNNNSTVTMVILPLRSQTLEIFTQGSQYLDDFNTYILPNFSFTP
jgi:hypothetical protein